MAGGLPDDGVNDPIANTIGKLVFGTGLGNVDANMQDLFRDILTVVRQIASSMGYGTPMGMGYSLAKGALLDSGPMVVTDGNTRRLDYVHGDGVHTDSVARQLADAINGTRNVQTALGGTDMLNGLSDNLAMELMAATVARRGTGEGDVLGFRMEAGKNTTADFEENLAAIRKEADPEALAGLEKMLSVRKELDRLSGEGGFTDDMDAAKRAEVLEKIKDVKELDGRKISSADIDTAVRSTSVPMNQTVISKQYVNDVRGAVAEQAEVLKAWSEMTGSEDLSTLQSMASRLKVDAISTKKGTEQLRDMMADVRTEAEMTGRSTSEVLQGYNEIANAYAATGRSYSLADVKTTYAALERFKAEEVSGTYTGPKTPEERAEEIERANIDTDNFNLGVYAARMYMDSGQADEEQTAQLQALLDQHAEAIASGDMEQAAAINKELKRYQTKEFGANFTNEQFNRMAIQQGKRDDDMQKHAGGWIMKNSAAAAKALMRGEGGGAMSLAGITEGGLADMLSSYTTEVGNTDDVKALGAMTSVLRKFKELKGDDLKKAIASSDKLNAGQKRWLQAQAENGMTGEQLYEFAHSGIGRAATTAAGRVLVEKSGDIMMSEMRRAAYGERKNEVLKRMANGEYNDDPDQMGAFFKAFFNTSGTPVKEQIEKSKKLSEVLKGDDKEAKIDALLQLKGVDDKNLIELTEEERKDKDGNTLSEEEQQKVRRSKAEKILEKDDVMKSITKSLDDVTAAGEKEQKNEENTQQALSSLKVLETSLKALQKAVDAILGHKEREADTK